MQVSLMEQYQFSDKKFLCYFKPCNTADSVMCTKAFLFDNFSFPFIIFSWISQNMHEQQRAIGIDTKSISWFLHWCILSTRFVPVEMKLENNEFFMRILLKDKNSDIFDLLIHLEQSEHFVARLGTFMNRLLMHCKPLWKVFAFSCNFLLFDEAEGLW